MDNKWGYIDYKNQLVIKDLFIDACDFRNSLATTEPAIPIHIKARGPARIGTAGESVGIGRSCFGEQISEGTQGGKLCIIVKI